MPITQYQQGRQTAIEYQIIQQDKFNHFALALTDIWLFGYLTVPATSRTSTTDSSNAVSLLIELSSPTASVHCTKHTTTATIIEPTGTLLGAFSWKQCSCGPQGSGYASLYWRKDVYKLNSGESLHRGGRYCGLGALVSAALR